MESRKQDFRHILRIHYRNGKNTVQVRQKLFVEYGEDVLTQRQCQHWFAKCRTGNYDGEDSPRSRRAVESDEGKIKLLIDANPPSNNS